MSNVTLEDLNRIVARIGESHAALAEASKASDERIRASHAETDERIRALTEASKASDERYRADEEERRREMDRRFSESWAKTSAGLDKMSAEIDKMSAEIKKFTAESRKWIGGIRNRMGQVTEKVLIPGIRPLMDDLGHDFTGLDSNVEFFSDYSRRHRFAEVDVVLENSKEVMVVEVKTHLRKMDVEEHLEQLRELRENEETAELKGKALYGAMAALQIDDDAREAVIGNGMYLIKMVADPKHVSVLNPDVVLREW